MEPAPRGRIPSTVALHRTQLLLRWAAVTLGLVAAWRCRHAVNPDGISYLDLGDAMLRGGLGEGLNSYWSPAYPLLLALVRALSGFSAAVELPLVHLVNFALYLGALVSFELLLGELVVRGERAAPANPRESRCPVDEGEGRASPVHLGLVVLGYPLFMLCSLQLVGLEWVTPDLGVAALALLAMTMVLRLERGTAGLGNGVALGLVLSLGYLTKSAMLPIGVLFVLCGFAIGRERSARRAMVAATLTAAVLAGAFVLALSAKHGRLTAGDSGRLNYAWHVSRVTLYSHARPDQGPHGTLVHPLRLVLRNPPVYEFAEPIGGTYPPWFDPGYWFEGVRPRFDWPKQKRALERSLESLSRMVAQRRWSLAPLGVVLAAVLVTVRPSWSRVGPVVRAHGGLLLVGGAPVLMYALVHLEPRYIGGFLLLLLLGLLGISLGLSRSPRVLGAVCAAAGLAIAVSVTWGVLADPGDWADGRSHYRVALALQQLGVEPGSPVGSIGGTYKAYWARLGRFRVVADIPTKHARRFWSAPEADRRKALDAFREAGVRAVVTEPPASPGPPWQPLEGTTHWVALLSRSPDGS